MDNSSSFLWLLTSITDNMLADSEMKMEYNPKVTPDCTKDI